MWRVRQKELELDDRCKGKFKDQSNDGVNHRDGSSSGSTSKRLTATNGSTHASCSSSKGISKSHAREDDGLRDEELEEFLHSRSVLLCASIMCMPPEIQQNLQLEEKEMI